MTPVSAMALRCPIGVALALAAGMPQAVSGPVQRAVARPGPPATVLWKVNTRAYGHAAVDSSTAYFLSGSHQVTAVSVANGSVRWQRETGEADPLVGNGVVLAGATVIVGDYNVTAWDRGTGAFRWRFVPPVGFGAGAYLGAVAGDTVLAGSASGQVYAIDVSSGEAGWIATIEEGIRTLVYEPVLDGALVYAGYTVMSTPTHGGVVALNAETGEERWRAELPRPPNGIGAGAAGKAVVVDDLVVMANRDGSIHAFAKGDGASRWVIRGLDLPLFPNSPVPEPPGPRTDFRALAATGRTLFAGSLLGYVVAYDLDTRRERWRHLGGQNGSIGFQLTADAQALYFPSFSGRLTAVNVTTGTERWRIGDGLNSFLFPPALDGSAAYASAFGGFYALRK
jgi:outer membrane protein assembly factor BamB